jgi:hypothetical protein
VSNYSGFKNVLDSLAFIPFPPKPNELAEVEGLIKNPEERKKNAISIDKLFDIKKKVMLSDEVIEYSNQFSVIKAQNYSNYSWLLEIHDNLDENNPMLNDINLMLNNFRELYDPKEIRNLPMSKRMQDDKRTYTDTKEVFNA